MAKSKQNRLTQGRRDAATQNVLMSHYVLSILRSQFQRNLNRLARTLRGGAHNPRLKHLWTIECLLHNKLYGLNDEQH